MLAPSFEKRALTRRKIIPYTANSAEKNRGCLGLDETNAFCVKAADRPDNIDAPNTIIRPRL